LTLELHRIESADLDAVAGLLMEVFNAPIDAPFINRKVLRWKYLDAGPQWQGSRSYALRKADKIHAHCAVWPLNLQFGDKKEVTCLAYIDWANRSDLPGAGFMLKKKLMKLSQTSIVVGGSAETREIVPKLGFAHVADIESFARVVRPWKQYRSRPAEPLLKGMARLIRNTSWGLTSISKTNKNWSVRRVESFSSGFDFNYSSEHPTPWRDANYLNFWLQCPAAAVTGFELINDGTRVGYFLLSRVGGQTRIADIRPNSDDPTHWKIAYSLAAETAANDPETCEILASASTPLVRDSLKGSNFYSRGNVPLFLYDPQQLLKDQPPMFWNLIDGDAAYLSDPAYPFAT